MKKIHIIITCIIMTLLASNLTISAPPLQGGKISVRLSWDGGSNWTSVKTNFWGCGGTDASKTYGGSTDNWGHTWTAAELSNTTFRLRLGYYSSHGDNNKVYVDHVKIKVHWDVPPDTCTYSSGDWDIEMGDNCTITTNVEIDPGSDIIFRLEAGEAGRFTLDGGNISGFDVLAHYNTSKSIIYKNNAYFKRG